MADQNLTIGIRADASQLRADLAIANAQVTAFGKELRTAATASLATGDTSHVAALAGQFEGAVAHAKGLKAEIAELGSSRIRMGLKETAEDLEKLKGGFAGGIESFLGGGGLAGGLSGKALAVAGVTAALGELFHLTSEAAERAHQIGTLSAALGVSTGEVKEWSRAANKGGVDAELYAKNMERLAVNAEKAADGLRKNVLEGAKLLAPALLGNDISGAVRGGKNDQIAAPTNMTQLAKDSPQLHKYVEGIIEDYKKLNEEGAKVGQAPLAIPSFESALFKTRLEMGASTKAAKELRDEVSKTGVDVGFKTAGEGLNRLAANWKDDFTKMGVEVIDINGKMREFASVRGGFLSGLAKLPETERLATQKREFGKTGIDPLFSAEIKREGDFINAGGASAPKFEDPTVAVGEEAKSYLNRIKGEWRDTLDDMSLGVLKWGREMDVALGFAKEGGGHGAAKALHEDVSAAHDSVSSLDMNLSEFDKTTGAAATAIASAVETVAKALSSLGAAGPAASALLPPIGNAAGGLIRGPGTGTSDSILARMSNGEFVVNATDTARNFGLLHAINSGFSPPGFAFGGPVSTDPGWQAPGHRVSTDPGRAVHLHLGGMTFELRAATHVVAGLEQAAHQSQLLSAGRRPGWNGG